MTIKIPEKISSIFAKVEGNNRYYAFVGVLFVFLLLDYFFLMGPQLGALRKIRPEIKVLSDNIKKAKEDIKKLNTYKADLENASKKFAEANLKIKSKEEISVVLEYIANVANETGVKIDQITPDMLGQELLTENNQRKYFDLPIYMEARSGYHDFGRFLNKIEQNDISLRVGTFAVVVTNDTRLHSIKMTFKATIFEDAKS
ncbi:MAG TPA: type 4a pilus biogenesis protein PilO [Candidatus Omnitrophota bacterium]|nr:type 4a pilus biogenesis protein PilO [Candidatus Omnitrophota bacterium]